MRGYRLLGMIVILCFFRPFHLLAVIQARDPYDHHQLQKDLISLKKEFGDILEIRTIGRSVYGKPIQMVRIGEGKDYILFVGAHHGREWVSANLLMMLIEHYATHYWEAKKMVLIRMCLIGYPLS